ncbi:hypothetical protein TNCV_1355311 [Trichonephila clavipes]|uniref:Uncharacterized protein n=1 Tax=Trichonephila clavipes TaxID=2585209 RepID=A0A8X6S621_TRICX|nr:hypothetical protein TNCV_1355311 [Trichonephila clavipes]
MSLSSVIPARVLFRFKRIGLFDVTAISFWRRHFRQMPFDFCVFQEQCRKLNAEKWGFPLLGATTSYTRAFGDRHHNLEPWSSDEDDTCAGTPPLLTTTPAGGRLSSRQIPTPDIPATSLYTRAFGDRHRNLEPWSSDEDDTCAGTPPLLTTTPAGGRLSSRQIPTPDIPATSLYTRAFGDRHRNLEPWSSDEDDTCAGTPPLLTTTPAGGRLSSRQIPTPDIPATSLYTRAFGDRHRNLEPWSSDEDDTCAGTPPLLTTTPAGGRLSSRQIPTPDIPATSLLP